MLNNQDDVALNETSCTESKYFFKYRLYSEIVFRARPEMIQLFSKAVISSSTHTPNISLDRLSLRHIAVPDLIGVGLSLRNRALFYPQ